MNNWLFIAAFTELLNKNVKRRNCFIYIRVLFCEIKQSCARIFLSVFVYNYYNVLEKLLLIFSRLGEVHRKNYILYLGHEKSIPSCLVFMSAKHFETTRRCKKGIKHCYRVANGAFPSHFFLEEKKSVYHLFTSY